MKSQLEKIKLPPLLKLLVKVAVSVIAIWFVLKQIDVQRAFQDLSKFSFWSLLGAFVFYNSSQIISAYRLNGFFYEEGIKLSASANLRLYYKGMFYNLILPGGIGGDGYKALVLKDAFGVPWKNLIRSLLLDRISGFIMLLYLMIPLFLLVVKDIDMLFWILATLAMVGMYPLFYFVVKKVLPHYQKQVDLSLALSFFVQLFQVMAALCLAFELGIPWSQFIFIFLLSSAASSIPFTLGGIGAREFVFVSLGGLLSVSAEHGFLFSIVFYLITVASSLLGAFVPSRKMGEKLFSFSS